MSVTNEVLEERENLINQKMQEQSTLRGNLQIQINAANQQMNELDATILQLNGHLQEVQHLKTLLNSDVKQEDSGAAKLSYGKFDSRAGFGPARRRTTGGTGNRAGFGRIDDGAN